MTKIEKTNGISNLFVSEEGSVRGYSVIDVRGPDEFVGELGHIKGAQLVRKIPICLSLWRQVHSSSTAGPV